ncbi:MAG: DUF11 domain-containing protein [Acidobacteriota bacterium]|nr:DUF11 domain-containing protein [Acidobacteriota bacterium]
MASPTTALAASADVLIDMTVQPNPVIAGSNVTYHIIASNNGPDNSTNVTVTDALPSGLSFVSFSPSQGTCSGTTTITCSFGAIATYSNATVDIVAQTTAPGTISNTASVSATEPDPDTSNNSVTKAVTANVDADMSIGISGSPASAAQGATLTYTITTSNAGPSPATNVTISDPLPSGSNFVSAAGTGWSCANSSGIVTCSRSSSSAVGALPNITLQVTPSATGTVTNAASITANESDPNSSNNTATTSNTVTPGADLAITQPTPASPVAVGAAIVYSLTVTNNGPGTASLISVSDALPANVTFNSVSGSGWSCSKSSGVITCTIAGPISSGAHAGVITINTTAASAGSAVNTATVSSSDTTTTDPTSANNTASTTVTIQTPGADLSLPSMTVSPNPVAAGSNVTYSITGKNNGPLATSGIVTLTDTLPSSLTFVSASGSGWSCSNSSGTVTCTTSNVVNSGSNMNAITLVATATGSGTISNSACVYAASPTDPNPSNNCYSGNGGTVTSTSTQADLAITQAAPSPDPVVAGTLLTYSFTVVNNGPNDATNVIVSDTLYNSSYILGTPSQGTCSNSNPYPSCNLGTLANGASTTVTFQVKPTVTGPRTNQGTVTSSDVGDPNRGNNASNTVTSTVNPGVDVALTHTATPEPVLAGTNLTYVLTAKNNGPSIATNVTITDTLPSGVTYSSATPSSGSCSQSALVVSCNLGSIGSGSQGTVTVVVVPNTTGSITGSSNVGGASSSGTVTIADALPAGLTPTGATGSGWTCTIAGQTVTCNRADSLAPAATYPAIAVPVAISATAPASISDTATISGGADVNPNNNSATVSTSVRPAPDLTLTMTNSGHFAQGGSASFTLTANNAGGIATNAPVTVTDALPPGLTPAVATGAGWTCNIAGQSVTCTRLDALAVAANYPSIAIGLTVAPNAAFTVTNNATVSGGGETNTGNDSASNIVTVNGIPDLTVSLTNSGTFAQGGTAAYAITASNIGGVSTNGTATIADTLPTGLTPVTVAGNGWSCSIAGQSTTCTRADALAAGASYPAISLAVRIAGNASGNLLNSVTVAGGGEQNITNDLAQSTATVATKPDLGLSSTQSGSFAQGSQATYLLNLSNVGQAATDGTTTSVTDTVPAGLTPLSATGTNWACAISGQTVTCTRTDTLAPGAAYPAISLNVNVAGASGTSLTNNASVAGGGDINLANNSSSQTASIQPRIYPI